ncbi:MAG: hypothetical protein QNI96_12620 [Woeseiaceae bacterium]|nr:hypothetical protein [Woeseiaceae bacterium]
MELTPDQVLAARGYLEELPPLLREKYGGNGYSGYSGAQIRVAIEAAELSSDHTILADVLFGDDESVSRTGFELHGREAIIGEIQHLIESEESSVVDRALKRLIEFLDKAGNISDGAGNDYT